MAEVKTKQNDQSVEDFLNEITDEKKRQDSFTILDLMKKQPGKSRKCGARISSALEATAISMKAGAKANGFWQALRRVKEI